jgi:hypothetical protein
MNRYLEATDEATDDDLDLEIVCWCDWLESQM